MRLPIKKLFRSEKGQALIIYLLILVIGAAIVLSVGSRVVTDIQVTTTSDESNRAYFAAEAGVEEALRRLQLDPNTTPGTTIPLDFEDLNATNAEAEIFASCAGANCDTFVYPVRLNQDEVGQVVFIDDFTDVTSGSIANGVDVNFYWGSSGSSNLEIAVLYRDDSNGNFYIRRLVYGSGFCGAGSGTQLTDSFTGVTQDFNHRAHVNIRSGNCGVPSPPPNSKPILARMRILNSTTPQPVAAVVTSGTLPEQGAIIESTGRTISGVARKVRAFKTYPVAPPFLDYVLFSGAGPIRK